MMCSPWMEVHTFRLFRRRLISRTVLDMAHPSSKILKHESKLAGLFAQTNTLPMLRHRVVAGGLEQLAVVEPDRAHRAATQAAGVERDDVFAMQQAERGPVAEDDGGIAALAPGHVEPRQVTCRDVFHLALELEFHLALFGADAHAGEGVDDDA